ncbi:MAG: hypothetical protein IPJ65_21100 [Archangiaceae bacterium]|nr:hypothetical protein [Archangiaceae bacterium]
MRLRFGAAVVLAASLLLLGCKSEPAIFLGCHDTGEKLPGAPGTKFKVQCPQLCTQQRVWGGADNDYTIDSSICMSAIHHGAVPAAGGETTVKIGTGKDVFKGSTENGITTADWKGKVDKTFSF